MSNCVTPTASLFGPAVTGLKSGSIYQSGLSYASNNIIEKKLGISPTKFITKFLDENLDKSESESESTFIDTGNRKKETKNIKFVQNLKDIENEHNNFVKAVKKMLKYADYENRKKVKYVQKKSKPMPWSFFHNFRGSTTCHF